MSPSEPKNETLVGVPPTVQGVSILTVVAVLNALGDLAPLVIGLLKKLGDRLKK